MSQKTQREEQLYLTQRRETTRRAFSQNGSFKIHRTAFLNYMKFVDPRIWGSKIGKEHVGWPNS